MISIILASQSPRRKKLLEQIGIAFEIFPSGVEEISNENTPGAIVEDLAMLKAKDVGSKFSDALIIGADTIVFHEGKVLEKPKSENDAFEMLKKLSGSTHSVLTGVAFVKKDKNDNIEADISFHEQTKVTFSTLLDEEIINYIKTGNPLDKAGAYGIQDDLGALFVEKIEGDFYNVVGLPLNRSYRELKKLIPEISLIHE